MYPKETSSAISGILECLISGFPEHLHIRVFVRFHPVLRYTRKKSFNLNYSRLCPLGCLCVLCSQSVIFRVFHLPVNKLFIVLNSALVLYNNAM
jgi:hypothetical protein